MKKAYSLILLLLCVSLGASAASKTKLYVNPGHGGYTSNDRQTTMPSVNGVKLPVGSNGFNSSNCFWESSGNTYRAWGIEYFWKKRVVEEAGVATSNSIKLSRYDNTQTGDLTLSTIASASSSYGGYFMSLHTNAGNNSANYMIVMCRSKSSSDYSAYSSTSLAMAKAAANWHDYVKLTNVTYSTPRGMTDRQFYSGSSLGVLRTNSAPGYLAESWFHDYRPEAFRLCSLGYNYFLAWQLMRAYLESPGLDNVNLYPIIVGDIRDLSKSCGYTSYTTRGRDKYLAINGATVTLRNVATNGTKTYTTDQFNNGFYTFYDCVPGATYEITVSKDGYKTLTQTITVTAGSAGYKGTQHLLNFDLEEGTNSGIAVSPTSVDFGEITAEKTSSKSVTVTGTGLTSAISVSSSNTTEFSVSATSLAATGGTLAITYKPSAAGSHSTTIKLTSGAHTKTLVVSGTAKNPPLTFTEVWNFSETTGNKATWMTDYTTFRNMAFGDGKLYVVNNSSEILILKAQTGEKLGELNMTGVEGGTLDVMDVNYVNGKVVACNLATTAEGDNVLKVYVWDNDNATPWVLLETTNIGETVRLGDTFNLKGDLTNGTLYFAEGKADTDTKVVSYAITNGVASTTPAVLTVTDDGTTGVQFGLSPRVIPESDGKFWCVGQNYYPTLFDADGLVMASVNSAALNEECAGNTFKAFTFKGTSYALATTYEYNATTSERLRKGRAVLLDGTAGWAESTNIGEYPATGLGSARNTTMSSGIEVAVNGTSGVEMWVLVHNQGIAYYKHGTAPVYNYGPTVTASTSVLELTTTQNHSETGTITVAGNNLEDDISIALSGTNADQFSIDETTIAKADGAGTITVTYDPTELGSHTATLTISSANATSITVTLKGTCNPNTYLDDENIELTESWTYTTTKDWFSTAPPATRCIAYNDGKLYVLNATGASTPVINIVDAYTGAAKGTLSVEGVSGGAVVLSNINVFDGKIFASSRAAASGTTGTSHYLRIYRWDSDTATPVVVKEDQTHGSIAIGGKMSFSGTLTSGRIWFANGSTVLYYDVTNGTLGDAKTISLTKSGNTYNVGANAGESEVVVNSDGTFWVDGKDKVPALFDASGVWQKDAAAIMNGSATAMKLFAYGTRKLAVMTTYMNASATSLADGAFVLADVANGVDAATLMGTYPEKGFVSTLRNDQHMTSLCVATDRENGDVLDVWVCCCLQGVAHYTYNGRKLVGIEDVVAEPEDVEVALVKNGGTLEVVGVEAAAVAVYSINGALVRMVNNANEVDVEGLNGVYVVAVVDAAGATHTQKVILK